LLFFRFSKTEISRASRPWDFLLILPLAQVGLRFHSWFSFSSARGFPWVRVHASHLTKIWPPMDIYARSGS